MRTQVDDSALMGGIFPLRHLDGLRAGSQGAARLGRGWHMPVELKIGTIVDAKYRVLGTIGKGGMGAVVRVEDIRIREVYALKYCSEDESRLLKRFAREVRIMQVIQHPNVVPVLDANLDFRPPYFVMPLAEHSLEVEIDTLKGDEDEVLTAFEQVCLGVQAVHNSGCVHRDIKPLNALRFQDGTVAVSDLGLAKIDPRDTTTLTQTDVLVGTRAYCAPEQLMPGGSREADARTDVFQLGKTLYQLLTGEIPALMDLKRIPAGLAYIIRRATREDPADRYANLGELMDVLEYYRRSKDPMQNPREAFESLVEQAKALLAQDQYDLDNLRQMLTILTGAISSVS